ncbi:transcriptional regulator, TetR family [Humidesulfovibrio mexicanus]|jgi:AcrR family transcriptional regulator|uniref:Transcriptional regulator, TetR family n=1 Tax=Humidesulfovibrio mexicanus TaxID=147047 RepID=A0A238ZGT0_9BACT|nr:CerR family C-terminal domain-containing protein [Humidesulfovibrio mexicanus]SNR82221.1 transcriptional regulator, TetR family [Humidesulfovibrio mexicanus]
MIETQDTGTKARLLHTGRKVFAENGLKNATIRDICGLAGANVASVNYHFGGKEKLYVAVLQDYIERENRRNPRDKGVTRDSSPEMRLRAYVRSLLLQTLGDGTLENERLGKLLTLEFIEPSQLFGELFEKHCRETHNLLLDIVRAALPGADESIVSRCASSIIGQCVLFDFAKEAMSRMNPALVLEPGTIDEITDFIMQFSLGGMERLRALLPHRQDASATTL